MSKFFIEHALISSSQLGFTPEDFWINQLLTITHEICKLFQEGFEVSGVFLDISEVFDNVWHEGLVLKLKQHGISGNLLNPLCDFQKNAEKKKRKQLY